MAEQSCAAPWRRLWVPLAAWAVSWCITLAAAWSVGADGLTAGAYVRWDSHHYLAIAQTGYEFFPCRQEDGYPPDMRLWCGNAGWLPGYPMLIRAAGQLGLSAPAAGIVLATGFHLLFLAVLWNCFLGAILTRANLASMAVAAVFPGSVYYHVVSPIAQFLFLAILAMYCYVRRWWVAAALCGMCAAFTYPTGFVLAAPFAFCVLADRTMRLSRRLAVAAALSGAVLAGLAAVMVLHHLTVGAWDAFFKVQAKYGHGLHNPASTLARVIAPVVQARTSRIGFMPAVQSLGVLVAMTAIGVWLLRRRREQAGEPADHPVLLAYLAAFWIFPLVIGPGVSMYRAESLLVPAAIVLRHARPATQAAFVVAAAVVCFAIARMFFLGMLL